MIVLRASCVSCPPKQRVINLLTVRVNVLTPNIGRSWSWLTLFDARPLRVNGPTEGRPLFSAEGVLQSAFTKLPGPLLFERRRTLTWVLQFAPGGDTL